MRKKIAWKITIDNFRFLLIVAAIPSEFTDCFGPYSPDAAAAAAMHYQFAGGYPPAPHGTLILNIKAVDGSLTSLF